MAIQVLDRLYAEQYTGLNALAIAADLPALLLFDDTSTFTFETTGGLQHSVNVGDWVIWHENGGITVVNTFDTAEFLLRYVHVTGVGAPPTPPPTPQTLVQSKGTMAVPASLLGQTQNYDVTVSPAMTGTAGVFPIAQLRGLPNIVSGHGIINVTVLSTTQVRVQVTSGAASLAGATIHVTAFTLG